MPLSTKWCLLDDIISTHHFKFSPANQKALFNNSTNRSTSLRFNGFLVGKGLGAVISSLHWPSNVSGMVCEIKYHYRHHDTLYYDVAMTSSIPILLNFHQPIRRPDLSVFFCWIRSGSQKCQDFTDCRSRHPGNIDISLTLKSRHSRNIDILLIFDCQQAKDYSGWLVKNRKRWSWRCHYIRHHDVDIGTLFHPPHNRVYHSSAGYITTVSVRVLNIDFDEIG